jgi:hypothetical protein
VLIFFIFFKRHVNDSLRLSTAFNIALPTPTKEVEHVGAI